MLKSTLFLIGAPFKNAKVNQKCWLNYWHNSWHNVNSNYFFYGTRTVYICHRFTIWKYICVYVCLSVCQSYAISLLKFALLISPQMFHSHQKEDDLSKLFRFFLSQNDRLSPQCFPTFKSSLFFGGFFWKVCPNRSFI